MRLVPDMTATDAARRAQGAPGQARLRRHRGEHDRRLRSHEHARRRAAHPAQVAVYKRARHRADALAAQRRLLAGLRLHRRAAEAAGRPLRARPRQRRARARRVLRDRVDQPEGAGLRRRRCCRSSSTCTSWRTSSEAGGRAGAAPWLRRDARQRRRCGRRSRGRGRGRRGRPRVPRQRRRRRELWGRFESEPRRSDRRDRRQDARHRRGRINALVVPVASDRDAFAARVVAIVGGDEAAACALPSSYRLVRLSVGLSRRRRGR